MNCIEVVDVGTNAKDIFRLLCSLDCNVCCPSYCMGEPISIKEIQGFINLSRYKIRRAVQELQNIGLVKRLCVGRPAVVCGYECCKLEREAPTPKHGWYVTNRAKETDIYIEEFNKILARNPPLLNGLASESGG